MYKDFERKSVATVRLARSRAGRFVFGRVCVRYGIRTERLDQPRLTNRTQYQVQAELALIFAWYAGYTAFFFVITFKRFYWKKTKRKHMSAKGNIGMAVLISAGARRGMFAKPRGQ